jgi:hypothetical protein
MKKMNWKVIFFIVSMRDNYLLYIINIDEKVVGLKDLYTSKGVER